MLFRHLNDPVILLYIIPAILLALTFHELSHAFVSYRLGDPTAKNAGRLTLNPMKHLDPLGALMMLVSFFGWAKPVPINPGYYRNRKLGTMLVSIAGPVSNLILAALASIPMAYIATGHYGIGLEKIFDSGLGGYIREFSASAIIFNFCRFSYIINISLAVFNIIPVPPLDGSKILSGILPPSKYYALMRYENYIAMGFLLIVFAAPGVLSFIMTPLINGAEFLIKAVAIPIVSALIGSGSQFI